MLKRLTSRRGGRPGKGGPFSPPARCRSRKRKAAPRAFRLSPQRAEEENMSVGRRASRCLSILIFSATAVCAFAQAPSAEYAPEVGQSGKDVVWVPSPQELVDKMLDMAKVPPKDYVIDLGSGDGRTGITAAKRGARPLGVEFNPDMVALSRRNAAKAGVSDKASFVEADIFRSDLSPATVINPFLLTALNLKLRRTILTLKPGTRIVSNTFRMGDWEPDQTVEL